MIKRIAKGSGNFVKKAISGTGDFVSTKIEDAGFEKSAEWVKQASTGIGNASGASISLAGQVVEGSYKTLKGQIRKDTNTRTDGVDDLVDAGKTLGNSVIHFVKTGATSTYDTASGLITKDYDKAKVGAWKLSQMAAISVLAVSVVDLVDGTDVVQAESIQAINAQYEGDVHPITDVPFERSEIEYEGQIVSDVFPVFDSPFTAEINESDYHLTDQTHNKIANSQLYDAIQTNPHLATEIGLNEMDINLLQHNITPDGYTWHHYEQPGQIQLVESSVHDQTAHTGGRFIWGGGSAYR